jgi:predicted RNase H-like nuclease
MKVGVDGCTNGWLAISLAGGEATGSLFTDISALADAYPTASLVLIDIPIGLWEEGPRPRRCDLEARRLLTYPRSLSVFPVPLRPSLAAATRAAADRLNRQAGGLGISCQTFAISPKIAEVDDFLRSRRERTRHPPPVRECHPELCLWALNGGRSMYFAKKTQPGHDERTTVLRTFLGNFDHQLARLREQLGAARRRINDARPNGPKVDYHRDDLLDALVLAITAERSPIPIPETPDLDLHGLPMEILYPPVPT